MSGEEVLLTPVNSLKHFRNNSDDR